MKAQLLAFLHLGILNGNWWGLQTTEIPCFMSWRESGKYYLLQELVEWDSPQWEDKREKGRKGPAQIKPLDYSGSRVMKL